MWDLTRATTLSKRLESPCWACVVDFFLEIISIKRIYLPHRNNGLRLAFCIHVNEIIWFNPSIGTAVLVQFSPWFKCYLIKFEPSMRLNHNIANVMETLTPSLLSEDRPPSCCLSVLVVGFVTESKMSGFPFNNSSKASWSCCLLLSVALAAISSSVGIFLAAAWLVWTMHHLKSVKTEKQTNQIRPERTAIVRL